ncbi:MAG: ribosome small subunit-dependent GTPase A [Flavobacteriales bacterium]
MPTGLVMRSTGSRYRVRAADGVLHDCVAKGTLRIKGYTSTNPIAVGDRVEFVPQVSAEEVGAITQLHERKNYIIRRSVNLSHHMHVIAANMDQALLIATVASPRTSFGFIDRFLVTAEAYSVPCVLVLNKLDACSGEERELLELYKATYEGAGYRVLLTSAITGEGVDAVIALLEHRVTLVAGHSGVGKSTLINAIDPSLDLWTQEISESSDKGMHTTTFAEMFELKIGDAHLPIAPTFIIDTPGIKGFGLVDMTPDEIVDQFPEMFKLKNACRFNDCKHLDEPGCAVKQAVAEGSIAASRYTSYVDMVNGVADEGSYRLD